jgi:hypothetical protein
MSQGIHSVPYCIFIQILLKSLYEKNLLFGKE